MWRLSPFFIEKGSLPIAATARSRGQCVQHMNTGSPCACSHTGACAACTSTARGARRPAVRVAARRAQRARSRGRTLHTWSFAFFRLMIPPILALACWPSRSTRGGATGEQPTNSTARSRFTAGAASRPRRPGAPAASATSTAAPPSQVHAPAPARRGLAHQLQQPTAASGVLGKIIHEPQLTTSRPARDCEIGAVTRSLRARWQSQGAGVRVRCSCTRRACSSCQSDAPLVSPA